MNKTKMVGTTIKEIVDHSTGEIIDTEIEKHFKTKVEKDKFFVIYLKYLSSFYGLTSALDIKLLIKMCELSEYNEGKVVISTGVRCDIMKELKTASSNISRSLKSLKNKSLITGDKGVYYINPQLFWKGSEVTRQESLLSDEGVSFKLTFYSNKENTATD